LTVGTERHLPGRPLMAFEKVKALPTASVPNANAAVLSRQGEAAAIRTVGHAEDEDGAAEGHLLLQRVQWLARLALLGVPDPERPVIADRGKLLAVRTESCADDPRRVWEGNRLALVALPPEEVPLPAAQVLWTTIEQLLGAAHVAGGQLAARQGDAMDVRSQLQLLLGLLSVLIVFLQHYQSADQTAERQQNRHRHRRGAEESSL